MSKTKTSLALVTIILLLTQLSTAGAEDLLDSTMLLSPSPSYRAAEIPVEQWRWADASPVLKTTGADTADPWHGRVPGHTDILTALLPDSVLDRSGKGDSYFMDESKGDLLKGEPEDTACVLGFRYSFSEFDVGHFFKSLFTLIARGNRPPDREEPGFAFYVDSPSR